MENVLSSLSYEILQLSNSEMQRTYFLKEISNTLLNWFKCSELKLLLNIPKKQSKYELINCTKDNFDYKIINIEQLIQYLPKDDGASIWDSILNSKFDSSSAFFSEKGSFWTINFGNLSISYRKKLGIINSNVTSKKNDDYSLLIIPFLMGDERVGLIQLKNISKELFSNLGTNIFEEFAQTLGIILRNQYTQATLQERVKELAFLYSMLNLTNQKSITLESILYQIIELIPPAWQYPDITQAKIVLNGIDYSNTTLKESEHKLVSDIVVENKKLGFIEVSYTEKCPELDESPFFNEEKNLLNNIAAELANIVYYKNSKD